MAAIKDLPVKARLDGRRALQALSSAALALPAYAAAPPAETTVDYHYFNYSEAPLERGNSSGAQRDRYDVSGHKLTGEMPLGGHYGLRADLTVESMSGASPWFITPDANGKPIQILSGATIDDNRQDLLLAATRYDTGRQLTASLGYSDENDYQALNLGFEAAFEPLGANYSYAVGMGYSDDRLAPTDGGSAAYPDRILSASRDQWSVYGNLTQILHAQSVLQYGVALSRSSGHLSDPYKLVYVESATNTVPDHRPDERLMGSVFLRWRRYFARFASALHLDYRYTGDDWEIETHTLEGTWVHRLSESWRLSSGLRYYSQSQADFYAPFAEQAPGQNFVSSDYRLSPYGALSLNTQLQYRLNAWDFGLGLEHYEADAQWALGSVKVANPGLLAYDMLNLRVAYRFE